MSTPNLPKKDFIFEQKKVDFSIEVCYNKLRSRCLQFREPKISNNNNDLAEATPHDLESLQQKVKELSNNNDLAAQEQNRATSLLHFTSRDNIIVRIRR
jgi:excinuclease UvrABC helicase subunit UvrB